MFESLTSLGTNEDRISTTIPNPRDSAELGKYYSDTVSGDCDKPDTRVFTEFGALHQIANEIIIFIGQDDGVPSDKKREYVISEIESILATIGVESSHAEVIYQNLVRLALGRVAKHN